MEVDQFDDQMRRLYHNNAVVHHAVSMWRHGGATKEEAYRQAMCVLAEQCDRIEKQLIELYKRNAAPPVIIPASPAQLK